MRLAAGVGLWDVGAGPLPDPRRRGHGRRARRSGRPRDSDRDLQRGVPFNETFQGPDFSIFTNPGWWRDRLQGLFLERRRPGPVRRAGRLRQARRADGRRHAGTTHRRAAGGADRPHPRQPLRDEAGPRLLDRVPVRRDRRRQHIARLLQGRDARPAAAVRALRPAQAGAGGGLRPHAAAAFLRRQLQPVLDLAQPVAVRRARCGLVGGHSRRPRAGRLLPRPRGGGRLRGVGRRGAPLPVDPFLDGDRRLLDGWLRRVQARRAVPGPVRPRPHDRRTAGHRVDRHAPAARVAAQPPDPDLGGGRGRAGPDRGSARGGHAAERPRLPLRVRGIPGGQPPAAGVQRPVPARGRLPRRGAGRARPAARLVCIQPADGLPGRRHRRRPRVLGLRRAAARPGRERRRRRGRRALGGLRVSRPGAVRHVHRVRPAQRRSARHAVLRFAHADLGRGAGRAGGRPSRDRRAQRLWPDDRPAPRARQLPREDGRHERRAGAGEACRMRPPRGRHRWWND